LQSVADVAAPPAPPPPPPALPVRHPPGGCLGGEHAALLVEDDDSLADRIDDLPYGRGERVGGGGPRGGSFVDHCSFILIQILLVQGFIPTNDGVRFVSR